MSHTLEVRTTGYRLLTLIQDAETGERGFLLTGNADYLKPYDLGRSKAPKALDELHDLVADNEMQVAALKPLATAVQGKLDDLALTVGLGRKGERDDGAR